MQTIGSWAFLIGVVLAVVLGALGAVTPTIGLILLILGLIVGFFNVTGKESMPFLMAGVSLVIVSNLGSSFISGISGLDWFDSILGAIMVMFVPATIVVAVKSVFGIASKK